MQGRAGKAPKREMVIESPQQYKDVAEIEAELEAGSQVAVVSLHSTGVSKIHSRPGSFLLNRTDMIWLFKLHFKSSFEGFF